MAALFIRGAERMTITKTDFTFMSKDGLEIHGCKYVRADIEATGAMQIAHGMAERASRYDAFAKTLAEAGYVVYANDHRGHGRNVSDLEDLGYLGEKNGLVYLIDDMARLTDIIRKENPSLPVFLFAHSMGSFAAQRYIMDHPTKIRGLILSGSNGSHGVILHVGKFLAFLEKNLRGNKAKSKLLDKIIFGSYNRNFSPSRTAFDWISRDENEVDKYVNNPYCGTVFPASFYFEFFKTLQYIENKANLPKIPKDLPILIVSGSDDPVGNFGKGTNNLYERYKSIGHKNVEYKIYDKARHELINEINRDEAISDIIAWLNKTLTTSES